MALYIYIYIYIASLNYIKNIVKYIKISHFEIQDHLNRVRAKKYGFHY